MISWLIKKVWNKVSFKKIRLEYRLHKVIETQHKMMKLMKEQKLPKDAGRQWALLQYEKVKIREEEANL